MKRRVNTQAAETLNVLKDGPVLISEVSIVVARDLMQDGLALRVRAGKLVGAPPSSWLAITPAGRDRLGA